MSFDLTGPPLRVHVVGVGGAGMSAIATVLAGMGHRVSGSDRVPSTTLDRLGAAGLDVWVGHRAERMAEVDVVTVSTAVPPDDPEVLAAAGRGVPIARRSDALSRITATRRTLAVAGTHGKTTTSSMLALALVGVGFDPGFIIGGDIGGLGPGARWTTSGWFVVEADESDGTFLELARHGAVVTNVEPDHLEHYGGFAELSAAFTRFASETRGPLVVCGDDEGARAMAGDVGAHPGLVTYGSGPDADYRIADVVVERPGVRWVVERDLHRVECRLGVPGLHHVRNATAALAAAVEIGAEPAAVAEAIAGYRGVGRRFEERGRAGGVTLVDDYAHLPTEVAAALEAAAAGGWGRIVCVFQPHRYSRTEALWQDFADAFVGADLLIVTELYGAGEAPRPGVSGRLVADAVSGAHPGMEVAFVADRGALVSHLLDVLGPDDLCLTLGAGDLTTLPDDLLRGLEAR